MKQGELARKIAEFGYALQEPWRKGELKAGTATYGALRAALGFEAYESASLAEWLQKIREAVAWECAEAVRAVQEVQEAQRTTMRHGVPGSGVFLGMERTFGAMKQVLEAEKCLPGTIVQATDTDRRERWDGEGWREIEAEA